MWSESDSVLTLTLLTLSLGKVLLSGILLIKLNVTVTLILLIQGQWMALLGKGKIYTCVSTILFSTAPVFGAVMLLNLRYPSKVHI